MTRFLLKRLALGVGVALAVSVIAFLLLQLTGDVAIALAGEGATPKDIEIIRVRYGLDRPLPVQYLDWLSLLLQGDLGNSVYFRKPVLDVVGERIGVTLILAALALVSAVAIALPLGILAALKPKGFMDRLALVVASVGQSVPIFYLSLLLMLLFGVHLRLLPISGSASAAHFVLPAISLGYYFSPPLIRLTRTGMIEAMQSDYIRTAYAKGLRRWAVVMKHALRNALLPVIALAAVQFGYMLSGSIITETIFSLQGLGHLAWTSIGRGDFPVLQGIILTFSLAFILLVLMSDLLSAWLDPRLRTSR